MLVTKKDIDEQLVVQAPQSVVLVWSYVVYLLGWYGMLGGLTAYTLAYHADFLFWVWLFGGAYLINDKTIQPHEWRRLWTGETPEEED